MKDLAHYSPKDLDEIRHELTKAREQMAKAKILYESMKDKRTLMIEKIARRIKAQKSCSVAEARGFVLDDQEYKDFQDGYEAAFEKYTKWKVQTDNLETTWETVRTVLAENRKERWNT